MIGLLLAAALAQDAPDELAEPTGEIVESVQVLPETLAPLEPTATPRALRLDQARYNRNMKLAEAGMLTGLAGVGVLGGGIAVALVGADAGDEGQLIGGIGLVALGGLGILAGAPIAAAGSVTASQILREGGYPANNVAGYVGIGLMCGGLLVGALYPFSYLAVGLQMVHNSTFATRTDRPRRPMVAWVRRGTVGIGGVW